jgi:hypothetical protein
MIYNTVSAKRVLDKIHSLRINTNEFDRDIINWIGDALDHIGCAMTLELTSCVVPFENYRAPLPVGLYTVEWVGFSGNAPTDIWVSIPTTEGIEGLEYGLDDSIRQINTDKIIPAYFRGTSVEMSAISDRLLVSSEANSIGFTYTPGYLKFDVSKGNAFIVYKRLPIDKDGFPLIPDDASFIDACMWYSITMMMLAGFDFKHLNYPIAVSRWEMYCTQARNSGLIPDVPMQESFKNAFTKLIPNFNSYNTGFTDLHNQERLER